MKVDFNPVSFRFGSQVLNAKPDSNPYKQFDDAIKLDLEHSKKAKNDVELLNYRLHDDNWIKTCTPGGIHLKFLNSYDGIEYFISDTGKVVKTSGWSSPVVIIEKHDGLAKYVQSMSEYPTKLTGVYSTVSKQNKAPVFGADSAWNGFTVPAMAGTRPAAEPASETAAATAVNTVKPADVDAVKPDNTVKTPETQVKQSEGQDNSQIAEPKKKTTVKEKLANIWKFFTNMGEMAKAAIRGAGYAAATAATLLAGSWVFNTLPKAFSKEGPKFMQIIKHPLKHIGKSGKIIAGIGAAAVMTYHLIVGRLTANQKTAVIDHKLHVGHRDV